VYGSREILDSAEVGPLQNCAEWIELRRRLKASIPVQGRAAFKCTRWGKVTTEAELRRLSMRRAPAEDD
jgi:hypothetical protein